MASQVDIRRVSNSINNPRNVEWRRRWLDVRPSFFDFAIAGKGPGKDSKYVFSGKFHFEEGDPLFLALPKNIYYFLSP